MFIPKIIKFKLISQQNNYLLVNYFSINKPKKFVGQKYHWLRLSKDIEAYIKGCNICLGLKAIKQKPYSNFQLLLISTHQWKDFLIDL